MRRFCLLSTFYPPWNFGGDGVQVERLAHALGDAGHEVTVVHSPLVHRLMNGSVEHPPREHPQVEVVALDESAPSLAGVYLSGRPRRARTQIAEVLQRRFDVIHFHNPSLLGAPAVLGMGDALKLYTAHEQWLLCPGHTLLRADGRVCEDPPCRTCELVHRRPPQPWRRTGMLARGLTHLDYLIAPSRAQAQLHSRLTVPIEVIEHFVPDPGGPNGSSATAAPYFLYVGRLERVKGVETLIDSFKRSAPADLVIAGDGGRRRRLRRRASGSPGIRFEGWVNRDRLDTLYRGALAVVVPSIGHESFGLVTAEAFARGVPAVVNRLGALAELADETGAALAYSGERELDDALARLAGDPALRAELGRQARAAYLERFTPERHLEHYLGLIDRAAA
jgi:glycosyltransferase involved in cell wall biosynthesis